MSVTFRKLLFWPHLLCGITAGLVIALMCVTGVAMTLEHPVLAWAERSAMRVAPPLGAAPLPAETLLEQVAQAKPKAKVSGITFSADARDAVVVSLGREPMVFVDPYSGEVRESGAQGLRGFFEAMEQLHRWLALEGDNRAVGKAITGASNTVFLFLSLSGLYLWWPKKWSRAALRSTGWFRRGLKGKARDFNWHNVIGVWAMAVLVVLTVSGMVISYRWASDLVFTLNGEKPPAPGPRGGPPIPVEAPSPDAKPLPLSQLFASVTRRSADWESISVRLETPAAAGTQPAASAVKGFDGPSPNGALTPNAESPLGLSGAERSQSPERAAPERRGARAMSFTVKPRHSFPRFATAQLAVNPFDGSVVREEGYAQSSAARKARSWLRFLHTGEALGGWGQAIAALASLGGAVLVYTGFALSYRRFFPRRRVASYSSSDCQAEAAAGSGGSP